MIAAGLEVGDEVQDVGNQKQSDGDE